MCAPQGLQNMDAYTILQSIVEAIMQRLHKEITLSKKRNIKEQHGIQTKKTLTDGQMVVWVGSSEWHSEWQDPHLISSYHISCAMTAMISWIRS